MKPAIRLENVSKRYRITSRRSRYRTLRESFMESVGAPFRSLAGKGNASAPDEYIWALENVSLDIQAGEVVGVIGQNGAGKSTLLKILARATEPTSGRVEFRGRVGSLLDVGTGFHSELAGRENIYLNGAILGMSKNEVTRKFDEIVDFAGVDKFIDTPIKHYSEGMRMRLAFAVAAFLDTEILLADEVLAVGDAQFQQKCLDAMHSLARSGRTVLFVNHNMAAIGKLCPKTILLEKGKVLQYGETSAVVNRYLAGLNARPAAAQIEPPVIDRGVTITEIAVYDATGAPQAQSSWNAPFTISVAFSVTASIPPLSISVAIVNQLGIRVLFSWVLFQQECAPGSYRLRGEFRGENLAPGRYYAEVLAEHYWVEHYHDTGKAVSFEIVDTTGEFGLILHEYGLVFERVRWESEPLPSFEPVTAISPPRRSS